MVYLFWQQKAGLLSICEDSLVTSELQPVEC